MEGIQLTETTVIFRLKRAEEFARQWRLNAKRLQGLASNPRTPQIVREDALSEARTAADIVGRRADELAEMARQRGYNTWEADPRVGPLVVEIRAVENELTFAANALSKV
jgi:hypothetical protein